LTFGVNGNTDAYQAHRQVPGELKDRKWDNVSNLEEPREVAFLHGAGALVDGARLSLLRGHGPALNEFYGQYHGFVGEREGSAELKAELKLCCERSNPSQ
jgi:hypothetical protein